MRGLDKLLLLRSSIKMLRKKRVWKEIEKNVVYDPMQVHGQREKFNFKLNLVLQQNTIHFILTLNKHHFQCHSYLQSECRSIN